MTVIHPRKVVVPEKMDCRGTATVTISFDAAASLVDRPTDIVLIMDCSSSMDNRRMYFVRQGAYALVNMVAGATTCAWAVRPG